MIYEFAVLLAQTPTPTPLPVKLLDEGGLSWRDLVVPAGTLIAALVGGIGGVVIGGRMNRTTMRSLEFERAQREIELEDARAAREDRLDAAHAERERAIESARADRERLADQRRALGALLLIRQTFAFWAATLGTEHTTTGDSPFMPVTGEVATVRAEDQHAAAMWASAASWTKIAVALNRIETTQIRRDVERRRLAEGNAIDADDYREGAGRAETVIRDWLDALTEEVHTLRRAMAEA